MVTYDIKRNDDKIFYTFWDEGRRRRVKNSHDIDFSKALETRNRNGREDIFYDVEENAIHYDVFGVSYY